MTDEVKNYEVTEARFIGGQHRAVGDPVKMIERAAKYYMQPHGTGLKLPAPVTGKPDGKSNSNVKSPADTKG